MASIKQLSMKSARPLVAPFPSALRCPPRSLKCAAKKEDEANPFKGEGTGSSSSSNSRSSTTSSSPRPPSTSSDVEDSVARLERAVKGRKAKPMEIRGVNDRTQAEKDELDNPYAPWAEGSLFPEGWDQMNPVSKVAEIYLGRRGILFWINKLAYAAVFVLIGLWVAFRFIGPALGFYKLAGDLMPPPL